MAKKALLHLAPGTKEDTASCREFFQEMVGAVCRSAVGGERRRARP